MMGKKLSVLLTAVALLGLQFADCLSAMAPDQHSTQYAVLQFHVNPSVGNFQSLILPSPVQETDFAASHHCAFWAALLSAQ